MIKRVKITLTSRAKFCLKIMTDTVDINIIKNAELHKALCKTANEADCTQNDVIEFCRTVPDGPLQYCTAYNSTVLHLACYFSKWDLAEKLFDSLSRHGLLNRLREKKNEGGDTVLHDACTSNKGAKLVKKMLSTVPELLLERNNAGETCVFRATAGGKNKIFDILLEEVDKYSKTHSNFNPLDVFQRDDGTTILHIAILTRNYDMAFTIAKDYQFLHHLQAGNKEKWTALQYLACSPEAFKSSASSIGLVKKLLYKCASIDEEGDEGQVGLIQNAIMINSFKTRICKLCSNFPITIPIIKQVTKMKKRHIYALKLSKVLIKSDTSWTNTVVDTSSNNSSREEEKKNGRNAEIHDMKSDPEDYETRVFDRDEGPLLIAARKGSIESLKETLKEFHNAEYESEIIHSDEAPLLMAVRRGCIDIVKETLDMYPQAVYYRNGYKENLLHVAIKTRNNEIFDYVNKYYAPFLRGQLRALDKDNNSILHMVGCPRKEHLNTKKKSPVVQLSEDLNLLKRLEDKCPSYLQYHRNNDMKTAGELFAERNEKLRNEAKEWMTKTAEHSIVVIILIATIAFTAAYTIPGGPDENGYPLLLRKPLFTVFTITDVLSLGLALTAMVLFLTIITSSYQFKDFRKTLPRRMFLGFTFLFLSMTIMMVAFAATIILTVNEKRQWTKIALYVVSFFPVTLFMIYYISIYFKLAKDGITEWVIEFGKFLPRPKKKYSLPCTTRPASRRC